MFAYLEVGLGQDSLDEVGALQLCIMEVAAPAVCCCEVGPPQILSKHLFSRSVRFL